MNIVGLAEWIIPLSFLMSIVTIIVHIAFAVQVSRDAQELEKEGRLIYGPALLWVLATLVGGVMVAVGYWVINHSRLRRD